EKEVIEDTAAKPVVTARARAKAAAPGWKPLMRTTAVVKKKPVVIEANKPIALASTSPASVTPVSDSAPVAATAAAVSAEESATRSTATTASTSLAEATVSPA